MLLPDRPEARLGALGPRWVLPVRAPPRGAEPRWGGEVPAGTIRDRPGAAGAAPCAGTKRLNTSSAGGRSLGPAGRRPASPPRAAPPDSKRSHGGAGPGHGLHDPRAAGARRVGRARRPPCRACMRGGCAALGEARPAPVRGGEGEKEVCEVSCGRARAFTSAGPFSRRLPGSVPPGWRWQMLMRAAWWPQNTRRPGLPLCLACALTENHTGWNVPGSGVLMAARAPWLCFAVGSELIWRYSCILEMWPDKP